MADSTAPILLAGGATALSDYIQGDGVQWRVLLASGIAAGVFALFEQANRQLAVSAAWLAFIASMVAPRGGRPAPVTVFLNEWNHTAPSTKVV